jgi:hypothetical protein
VADSEGVLATTSPTTEQAARVRGWLQAAQAHGRTLYGSDGSLLWQSKDGYFDPQALAPDAGVAEMVLGYSTHWGLFRRATGRRRLELDGVPRALAFARGAFYFASSEAEGHGPWTPLGAVTSAGKELWRFAPDEMEWSFVEIAPLARRLVAIDGAGHLVCLGE